MSAWRDRLRRPRYDAVVVGAGPNGLAAAITLASAGRSVLLLEAAETAGGGARTAELTLPGFRHDVCSAIHPMAIGSPFFRALGLGSGEVEWIESPLVVAHALDGGRAVAMQRSVAVTAEALGADAAAWRALFAPLANRWDVLAPDLLAPLVRLPRRPLAMAAFARHALRSARGLAEARFSGAPARALFAGLAAHAIVPLEFAASASFALVLGAVGHALGWPLPRGGSQAIADALVARFLRAGGELVTGARVAALGELPPADRVLLDVTPRQLLAIAGARLPGGPYRRRLEAFRYGPGVFKLDLALDAPVPWAAPDCLRAATVHVGGTLEEIARSEADAWEGRVSERPFVLVAQPSLFDATRAPAGKHVLWAYCHVPNGCTADVREAILGQIERFAPGFRDRILAVSARGPAELEAYDANDVGGDIAGGAQDLSQMLARPALRLDPYATPIPGVFLCSASTPPGGGVHGMCGHLAALSALRRG